MAWNQSSTGKMWNPRKSAKAALEDKPIKSKADKQFGNELGKLVQKEQVKGTKGKPSGKMINNVWKQAVAKRI